MILVILLIGSPLAAAAVAVLARPYRRALGVVTAVLSTASLGAALFAWARVLREGTFTAASGGFRFDPLAVLLTVCVAFVSALAAYGVAADVEYVEGQDPATTILEAADRLGADVIVVGATKQLFDESQWESVSTRVISEARRPVLVVPTRGHAGNDDQ